MPRYSWPCFRITNIFLLIFPLRIFSSFVTFLFCDFFLSLFTKKGWKHCWIWNHSSLSNNGSLHISRYLFRCSGQNVRGSDCTSRPWYLFGIHGSFCLSIGTSHSTNHCYRMWDPKCWNSVGHCFTFVSISRKLLFPSYILSSHFFFLFLLFSCFFLSFLSSSLSFLFSLFLHSYSCVRKIFVTQSRILS